MKRRVRSNMTIEDANTAVSSFAKKLHRMAETTHPATFNKIGKDSINVMLLVEGNFGVANDFFEALRVLGEHKLPNDKR